MFNKLFKRIKKCWNAKFNKNKGNNMSDYGLKIGGREITVFSNPQRNEYGLSNGTSEFDLNTLFKLQSVQNITTNDAFDVPRLIKFRTYDDWYSFEHNTSIWDEGDYAGFSEIKNLKKPTFVKPFTNEDYGLKTNNLSIGEFDYVLKRMTCRVESTYKGKSEHRYLILNFTVANKFFNLHQVLVAVNKALGQEVEIFVENGKLAASIWWTAVRNDIPPFQLDYLERI